MQIKELVGDLEEAEDNLQDALTPFLTAIFGNFYAKKAIWLQILQIITELDCLASLAATSGRSAHTMCRPAFRQASGPNDSSYLRLTEMVHPCVVMTNKGSSFIPNDLTLDHKADQSLLLVTGPNMGGKSTLLRSTALCAILAQIGCFVPAQSCELTPIDRIFTRIGASDRILEGKSTFYVEMEETQSVLKFATNRSLAILDELGRGTSTFDGYAIAKAVMNYMVRKVNCMTLFSTHYHMLLHEFRDCPGVQNYHMAYKANTGKSDRVTFLFKFIKGECPESFGMNVARMAMLPATVL